MLGVFWEAGEGWEGEPVTEPARPSEARCDSRGGRVVS